MALSWRGFMSSIREVPLEWVKRHKVGPAGL